MRRRRHAAAVLRWHRRGRRFLGATAACIEGHVFNTIVMRIDGPDVLSIQLAFTEEEAWWMAVKTGGGFCFNCRKHVMTQRNAPDHVLHLLLSIVTGGLWIIVWIVVTANARGGSRCTECGHKI